MKTYSFDGHDRTSELSGHLKFLLLEITDMVKSILSCRTYYKSVSYHNHRVFNSSSSLNVDTGS